MYFLIEGVVNFSGDGGILFSGEGEKDEGVNVGDGEKDEGVNVGEGENDEGANVDEGVV